MKYYFWVVIVCLVGLRGVASVPAGGMIFENTGDGSCDAYYIHCHYTPLGVPAGYYAGGISLKSYIANPASYNYLIAGPPTCSPDGIVINKIFCDSTHWDGTCGDGHTLAMGTLTNWSYAGEKFTANVAAGCTNITVSTNNNQFWCCISVQNLDAPCHQYGVKTNGQYAMQANGKFLSDPVGPGSFFSYCITSSLPVDCYSETYRCFGEPFPTGTNQGTLGTNTASGPANPGTQTGGGTQPPSTIFSGGTNGGIVWTNSGPLNSTNVTMIGDNALYNELTLFANQNHWDLTHMSNTPGVVSNSIAVSNNITLTNAFTFTNLDSGVSNLLGAAQATNGMGSNIVSLLSGTNSGTNTGSISNSVSAFTTSASAGFGAITNLLGDAPSIGSPGVGSDLDIAFVGGTILHLDPAVRFPGFMELAWVMWSFVLLVTYVWSIVPLLEKSVANFSTLQTGGVPDLEVTYVGTGGNGLGLTASVAVPIIICAMYALVFTKITSMFVGGMGAIDISHAKGAFAQFAAYSPAAAYILYSSFPVALLIGLVWSRIWIWITTPMILLVSAAFTKFLIGK